jgi:prepilin-type N-terminal cleavage/methylation domain-containing protein
MRKGFTLTELLILVVIIVSLAAIAIPRFRNNQPRITVEVMCPISTTEPLRDTLTNVTDFYYLRSHLELRNVVADQTKYTFYPNTCIVKRIGQ